MCLKVVRNSTGILLKFHNLDDKTYQEVEKFMKKKILKECKKKVKNISEYEAVLSYDAPNIPKNPKHKPTIPKDRKDKLVTGKHEH